jgi:hypothetical protein
LLQGTGGSAAVPWRIVERNCSRHYTMIGYISTKLLLIGIIKNYNRGSFNLAVISVVPASIKIVSVGLPVAWKKPSGLSEKIAKRGNNNCDRPRTFRNRLKVRSSVVNPALESFPIRKIN